MSSFLGFGHLLSKHQNHTKDGANFCGLLSKANFFFFFNSCFLFSVLPEYSLATSNENGGLGIALENGSLLFEVALKELHATTKVANPNRSRPTRLGKIII